MADLTRQDALALKPPQSVWIVGCGGVGYWTAFQLALAGVPELVLFDPDTVSDSNFNRIPYVYGDAGRNKAQVLAEHIQWIRPGITIVAVPEAFTVDTEAPGDILPGWLVATTDTWKSRTGCSTWCQNHGVFYIEAAAEGEIGSIAKSPADFATPEEEMAGYASVPVWAGPCISAGLLITGYIMHAWGMNQEVIRFGWNGKGFSFYDSNTPETSQSITG